jgi:hypothetical protein
LKRSDQTANLAVSYYVSHASALARGLCRHREGEERIEAMTGLNGDDDELFCVSDDGLDIHLGTGHEI